MAKRRVKFTFPTQLVTEPVIYMLGKKFEVVTNIRRANVEEKSGWVVLAVEGSETEIQKGLKWVSEMGARVEPVTGDVVEG